MSRRTNCITTWLDNAEQTARDLDQLPPEQRGPFHGVPFSVKVRLSDLKACACSVILSQECYDVAGTPSTAGMTKFARTYAKEDCTLVSMIKKLGGVPFCKTNVPQVRLWFEGMCLSC